MGAPIASFDVFDTCLVRDTIAPSEIFRRVARSARPFSPAEQEDDFISARIEAEARVRRAAREEEITLEQIWSELARMLGLDTIPNGPAREMEAEAAALHPIASTLLRIQAARTAGKRVIFISDTYLPA